MYDEKAKARMVKYMQSKRESLRLNLPLGTKDLWKDYAADYGMSVTELITKLIEKDMKEHNWSGGVGFNLKKWGLKPQKLSAQESVIAILCGFFYASAISLFNYSSVLGLQAPFFVLPARKKKSFLLLPVLHRADDSKAYIIRLLYQEDNTRISMYKIYIIIGVCLLIMPIEYSPISVNNINCKVEKFNFYHFLSTPCC